MKYTFLVVAAVFGAFSALALEDAHKEILEPFAKWDIALNEGKPEALLDIVTEDFDRTVPGQPNTVGKTALLDLIKPYFAKIRFQDSKHVIDDVTIEGDTANVSGSFSVRIVPLSDEKPYISKAKFTGVCKRQADGTYKLAKGVATDNEILSE